MMRGRSGVRGPGDDADWPIDASAEDEAAPGTNTDNRMLSAAARLRLFSYNPQAVQAQVFQQAQARAATGHPNASMVAQMSAWHEAQYQDMAMQARYRQQYMASMQQQAAVAAAGQEGLAETVEDEVTAAEEAGMDPAAGLYSYGAFNLMPPGGVRGHLPFGSSQRAAVGLAKKTALLNRQRALAMASRVSGAGAVVAGAPVIGGGIATRGAGATDEDAIAIDSSDDEEAPTVPPPKTNLNISSSAASVAESETEASESLITSDEGNSDKKQSALSPAGSATKIATHKRMTPTKKTAAATSATVPITGNSSSGTDTGLRKGISSKKAASPPETLTTKRTHTAMAGGKNQSSSGSTTKAAGSFEHTKKSAKLKMSSHRITPASSALKSSSPGGAGTRTPSSPLQKKRKMQKQVDRTNSSTEQVVVVAQDAVGELPTLAGPFVQGYLRTKYPQNDREILVHEISSKLIYLATEKDDPIPDVARSIRISFDRVEQIANQMIEDQQSAVQEAVRDAFRECQGRHDQALKRATKKAETTTSASLQENKNYKTNAAGLKIAQSKIQRLEGELAALKKNYASEVDTLKKKHAEEVASLEQKIEQDRRNQARSLNGFMKASVNSLRLLRKKNVYGPNSNNTSLGGAE